ncbi:hypothetical protein CHS0354_036091 [Potamilus streckersoni]|uniref:RRM domain-containing protein n=1 Tax=Potamilus streckersoni TaxID=2493646 RepID=A0AAE0SZN0_9BIVA|nr:hypothetical protein CHS0354_036091 [Potamilus streckersoni]
MWSQRDPSLRKSGIGNVFNKNLDKSIDNKALYDTFSAFGNILSCQIVCDEHGSRGYGFVYFETEEAARNAIEKVNGMLLNGKKVFVGRFMNRRERMEMMGNKVKKFNNVYLRNLSEDVDDNGLRDMFEPYGKIISTKVMTTFDGKRRGFGFVSFEEPESAERAVEEMNGKELRGKVLFASQSQKKTVRQAELKEKFERIKMERINHYQGVNLYVKNLDDVIDDERLRKEFSLFGNITSARLHEPVRSTSPPQRSQMATQRSSSPMYPLSPSPPSFLRSLTPPPRSPTECFRPITPPQPGTSGLSRQLDMEETTWDLNGKF